jgi:hypothetical protein
MWNLLGCACWTLDTGRPAALDATGQWRWTTGQWRWTTGQWRWATGQWSWTTGQWRWTTGQPEWRWTTGQWRWTTGQWRWTTGQWRWTTGQWRWTTGQWSWTTGQWRWTTGLQWTPSGNGHRIFPLDSGAGLGRPVALGPGVHGVSHGIVDSLTWPAPAWNPRRLRHTACRDAEAACRSYAHCA